MSRDDEIKSLRKEVAELRKRIEAMLDAWLAEREWRDDINARLTALDGKKYEGQEAELKK